MKHLVIGGTGTLGSAVIAKLYSNPDIELTCLSRDELKQQQLKARFPRVRFMVGDIRDRDRVAEAMNGVETAYLVAALKHVDVLEDNVGEAIKTNVLGVINVAEAAVQAGVRHVVFSSTDKAVLPINTYGMTKGISERYLLSLNRRQDATKFSVFRWGNVAGSRGSVINTFAESLKAGNGVRITDSRMTRFWIHIDDAVEYLLSTYRSAAGDRAMIPPMRAALVTDIAAVMAKILGVKQPGVVVTGLRAGEKIHECLESSHNHCVRSDTAEQFSKKDLEVLLRRVALC